VGYVYNDLKPDNICVGKYHDNTSLNELKLIDFGLATPYLQALPGSTTDLGNEHIEKAEKQF